MSDTSPLRNEHEVRIFAMRRSGGHAFLNWLSSLFPGSTCFLNDVTRFTDISTHQPSYELPSLTPDRRACLHERKHLLMYNFEDVDLQQFGGWWLPPNLKGESFRTSTILLLRDPFNLFASRLKTRRNLPESEFALRMVPDHLGAADELRRIWMQHAREYLQQTTFLGSPLLVVSYNRWVFDKDYRTALCEQLSGLDSDAAMRQVPRYGFGSSFEGYRDGILKNRIGLLHRWRHFQDDPEYESLVADPELQSLSNKIFGAIREK